MKEDKNILIDCFNESLRKSETCFSSSFLLLSSAVVISQLGAETFTLPFLQLTIASKNYGLLMFLVLHFVNGIRYLFFINRTVEILKLFDTKTSSALRYYPAMCTSSKYQLLICVVLGALTQIVVEQTFVVAGYCDIIINLFFSLPFIFAIKNSSEI